MLTQHDPMSASSLSGATPSIESVIKPISGQARLTRNCSQDPLKISDGPRLQLEVQVDEIPICLSDQQYLLLTKLLGAFRLRMRAGRFRRWRPNVGGVIGHGKAWWRFAQEAALYRVRKRSRHCSLGFALRRARQNVVYVSGYTQHLTQVSRLVNLPLNKDSCNTGVVSVYMEQPPSKGRLEL